MTFLMNYTHIEINRWGGGIKLNEKNKKNDKSREIIQRFKKGNNKPND